MVRMDALDALLRSPRANGAFLLRSSVSPPWCVRIEDEAPLSIVAIIRGTACVVFDDNAGHADVGAGDVMLCRGPIHYRVADDPDTPAGAIIRPGQVCVNVDESDRYQRFGDAARTWGNAADGPTMLVTGTYEHATHVSHRLLAALDPLTVVRRDEWNNPILNLLVDEVVNDVPGQTALLDRLLDLLCLTTVRAAFTRPGGSPPGWYRAASDPIVGPALSLIHTQPAQPWTVAGLGAAVGASRALLARRFSELVGEPPMTYLTRWRLDLAADHLDDNMTVSQAATAVGYASPFAFSSAFKRRSGVSPSSYRQAQRDQRS
jgi:AraC-like DNA-binding protein